MGINIANRRVIYSAPSGGVSPAMSLVLAAASSQYLSKTWGSAPTNGQKATIAFFIKRVGTSYPDFFQDFYDGGVWNADVGVDEADIRFRNTDTLDSVLYNGTLLAETISTDTITDTTTWHHLAFVFDSTQATAANRMRIYLDAVEVAYGTQTAIIQNNSYHLTDNGIAAAIGRAQANANRYLDAKLAYFYFIDGQALTPSSFTTGSGAGTTHPATYGGSYGTNGFFLNFSGSNANDSSGNSNNWAANNAPTYSSDIPT